MNQTLVESACSMLNNANLLNSFWQDTVEYAGQIRNIVQISPHMNPSLETSLTLVDSKPLAAKLMSTYLMKNTGNLTQRQSAAYLLDMQRTKRLTAA
jgi:hypothetical protein